MEQLNNNMEQDYVPRMRVFCPLCRWRLMDKVTPLNGTAQIKCPNCHRVVEVDLKLRLNRSRADYGFRAI